MAARRLAEAGNGNQFIKAVTGHVTDNEVARYTRDADQVRMADQAIASTESEQKLSNLEDGLDKTDVK